MNRSFIINKIQQEIMDHSTQIDYAYTIINNLIVLHIYNPDTEVIHLNKNITPFYKKLEKMLFDKNRTSKNGCFNYEHMDDSDPLYNYSTEDLINRYMNCEYCFILLDITKNNMKPLSFLILDNKYIDHSYIWNVCTDLNERKKNYMTYLLGHIFNLIAKDKLRIHLKDRPIKLKVRNNNPHKEKLIQFYSGFKFEIENPNDGTYAIMSKKNN